MKEFETMKKKLKMNDGLGRLALITLTLFGLVGAAVAATGTSPKFKFSLKEDGVRQSAGDEILTYSNLWDGDANATVTISQDGAPIAEGLTGASSYAWDVAHNGTYVLTHTTYTNGVAGRVETATFVVSGKAEPFAPSDVTVTSYSNKYDGAAHGIAVASEIEGFAIKYGLAPDGEFDAEAPTLTDAGEMTVWCELSAPGYITETNSATVTITKREVTLTSGSASKEYDGTALGCDDAIVIGDDGFIDGEGVDCDFTGSQTMVGTSPNTFTYTFNGGAKAANYAITMVNGTLEVTKPAASGFYIYSVKQRYPWNGLVDFSFVFSGMDGMKYDIAFSAKDMTVGTNITMATVYKEDGSVANMDKEQLTPGTYNWVWNAAADLPKDWKCDRVTVTGIADVSAFPYSVKFNANGGTGTMANESFTYGTAKALTANAFTRTGYTFQGWATSGDGAVIYSDGQSVSNLTITVDDVVDLYAVWSGNNYSVKFNANGGTGTMSNESFTYGVAKALTANAFSKSDYSFFGWSKNTTAVREYTNKQTVSNLTTTPNGTVNLYAIWTISSLANGLNCTALPWRTTGDSYAWYKYTAESHDGSASVKSSDKGGEYDSWMETTIKGPATISFYYAKSCMRASSKFTISRGSTIIFTDSKAGVDQPWVYKSFSIPSGTHNIRFNFYHGGTEYIGGNIGVKIDQFQVTYN